MYFFTIYFYIKNIPVLHFFTGPHNDYHKPSDDADKINYKGIKTIVDVIIQIIEHTDLLDYKLRFTKTKIETVVLCVLLVYFIINNISVNLA